MYLIQLLLPLLEPAASPVDEDPVTSTREELVRTFGGLTAYVQTPASGVWTAPDGVRERDRVVLVEVVAERFDRAWWQAFAARLRSRFDQEEIHIRALGIELLSDQGVGG